MKNAVLKKLFAIVLVITMCVSLLPVSAAAEEPAGDAEQTEEVVYQANQELPDEEPDGQIDEEPAEEPTEGETPEPAEEPDEQIDEEPVEGETTETVCVVFACEPAETEVIVRDAEDAEIPPEEDGSYLLVPGSYTYSASCEGYVSAEAVEFVIEDGAEAQKIEVSLQAVQNIDGNIASSGECGAEGDNLKWTLDENGALTISGTGAMADFDYATPRPWVSYKTQIKTIIIENGATTIGYGAFAGCTGLSAVTIPDSVTSIGRYAFASCQSLTHVTIPAGVTSIGNPDNGIRNVFRRCDSLVAIDADPQNQSFMSKDGVLYDKAMETLLICPGGKTGELIIPDGVKAVTAYAAISCYKLTGVKLPNSMTTIGFHAFEDCSGLTQLTIPESVTSVGFCAFANCVELKEIEFCHSAEAALKFEYGGDIEPNSFSGAGETAVETTITVPDADNINPAISGYDWAGNCRTVTYKTANKPVDDGTEIKLDDLAADQAGSGGLVKIDVGGTVYTADENGSFGSVEIAENEAVIAAVSEYNTSGANPHSQYPTGMEVYLLYNDNGTAEAKRIPEFDDLLRYSGCSIRITGNKGIRMITSVDGELKASLINGGVAGYTLEEYGTLLCFSSEMVNGSLCLEDSYARHNYAYSRAAGTDPVFNYVGSTIQYTNVLVGFDLEQCADDIAMRPYIILSDASGNRFTIYGGIVQRSIGYIAYQNRSAFASDDPAYDYIWDIIHHVYGDKYDADYKK